MLKSITAILLLCTLASCYTGIWPEQLAFVPPSSTGWANLDNSATNLVSSVVFSTNPILVSLLDLNSSVLQTGNWGFSVISSGYVPSVDISGENVTLYVNNGLSWQSSESGLTNSNGQLTLNIDMIPSVGSVFPVLHLLHPDNHFGRSAVWKLNVDTPTIVFTIDGTLTTGGFSTVCGTFSSCNPNLRADAVNTALYWYNLDYQILYIGVRPPSLYETTVNYLVNQGLPPGILILADTADDALNNGETVVYSAVTSLTNAGGVVFYAYGSSDNDISGYEQAGVAGKNIYVVGGNSGDFGSVDIGNDFTSQYNNFTSNVLTNPIAIPTGIRLFGQTGTIENATSPASTLVPFFAAILAAFCFLLF